MANNPKTTIKKLKPKTISLKKVIDRVRQTNDIRTDEVRSILQDSSINFLKLDQEQRNQFNIVTETLQAKIRELDNLENLLKSNTIEVPYSEIKSLTDEIENLIKERFIDNRIPRGKALLVGQGKGKQAGLTKEELSALKFQKIKLDAPALQRRTPEIQISKSDVEYIRKLFRIADGLEAGNWDELADIRDIIGLDPKDWQRGHTSSSIVSFNLELLLKEASIEPVIRKNLQKLLLISKLIDQADANTFKSIESKLGKPIKNLGYENAYIIIGEIIASSGIDISTNIEVSKEIKFSDDGNASLEIHVDYESTKINALKGKLSQVVASAISDLLIPRQPGSVSKLDYAKLFGGLQNLTNIEGSPPLLSVVESVINSVITNKKIRKVLKFNYNFKGKATKIKPIRKATKKLKPVPNANLVRNKFKKIVNIREAASTPVDVFNIQVLINQILAKSVQDQMADSAATDGRLRYQTGRFADSASLLTLTRSQQGLLVGSYTYMRNPYDVFLPGHKLGTPKRDPRIYVEGAIRQAAITVLKNRFPGIALELK